MKIVQAHGCFDLLHLGHIRHLQAAKAEADYLIVTVTSDRYVQKGPGRPAFTALERMEALRGLGCVDDVELSDSPTAAEAIRRIKPTWFAKGPDYSAQSLDAGERQALSDVGGRLLITDTEKWSSTALLNPRQDISPDIQAYLSRLNAQPADVLRWLEKARSLKVAVIGEAITDDYHYGKVLGVAGKEPYQVFHDVTSEQFIGGADAVASHARAVCDDVICITGPAITKRRYIETYPFQKVFGTYVMDKAAQAMAGEDVAATLALDADVVIVADYGHGFLVPALMHQITQQAPYLAVNVQANAGNHGYSTISKYPHANFVSIAERELRLDARDETTDVRDLMRCAATTRNGTVLVTRGAHGCMAVKRHGPVSEAPAFATHTVDRVGAGDAVFAVTACCAAVGMPLDLLCYVAAVVGTQAVGIVGNARYIERDGLHRAIESWLR